MSRGRLDNLVHSVECKLGTVGPALDNAPLATGSHIHFLNGDGEDLQPPPSGNKFWIRDRLEYKLAGRIEDAGYHDLRFSGICDDSSFIIYSH